MVQQYHRKLDNKYLNRGRFREFVQYIEPIFRSSVDQKPKSALICHWYWLSKGSLEYALFLLLDQIIGLWEM